MANRRRSSSKAGNGRRVPRGRRSKASRQLRAPRAPQPGLLRGIIAYGLMGMCIECCSSAMMTLATGQGDPWLRPWMHPDGRKALLLAVALRGLLGVLLGCHEGERLDPAFTFRLYHPGSP
jgi:hypothetical protein